MTESPNILLVDDRDENLTALEALLCGDDVALLKARSGEEALELLLTHEVALALIDVQMPEMDGFELAELMRGARRSRGVPIIFVTASVVEQTRVFRGYESGAVDFLCKPLDARVLRSKVDVFLQLHRQRQQLAEQLHDLERIHQALRDANVRKDEFLGLLSHELRNPLTPIRTSLHLLHHSEPGSAQAQRAQAIIDRQFAHLSRLVDDLLDITRITRGKVNLQTERVELAESVRCAADDHRAAFADAGIDLTVSTPTGVVWCEADATRIAQAIGNLLGNALKFTSRGGHVELSLDGHDAGASIRVRDNGAGISSELIDHIFQPFTQADRTLDRSTGGLGLGLALVKGMVELHGGTISAHSDGPGRGAEFVMRLPVLRDEVPDGRHDAMEGRAPVARRVLVIEDNADAAESLRDVLELGSHKVEVASSGPAGIEKASSFAPDIVLCDIGLPGMDGYAVARALRANPRLRTTFLVALTGYALPEDIARAHEAGFDEHLAKPPDLRKIDQLLAALPEVIRPSEG